MTTHQEWAIQFLHWFWVAFFVLFGIYVVFKPDCFTRIRSMFVHAMPRTDEATRARIQAAVVRREEAEHIPRTIGLYIGGVTLALGIVAAFTWIQPAMLYGVMCLVFAAVSGITYLQLRNMQPKRIAVLAPRTPVSVISPYWFAAGAVSAVSILTYAMRPEARIASIIVCISSIATTAIAWRLTSLPALLSGQDVATEQLVDERVRALRSSNTLGLAIVQPFVLAAQFIDGATPAQLAAFFFSVSLFVAYMIWSMRRLASPLPTLTAG
jgi:hypothetical protein